MNLLHLGQNLRVNPGRSRLHDLNIFCGLTHACHAPQAADKAFILGFFLPTFLLVLAIAGLFHDQPWAAKVLAVASQKDGWDTLAYFVLAIWGVAVLLMMANHMQLQILEGYRWPVSKMSTFRRREEKRFERKKARADQLTEQWSAQGDDFPEDKKRELALLRRELAHEFPPDPGDLLPTRLGNAIRAFEVYSSKVYGADSIPLWLHLSTLIPATFQSALDDARAQVNCTVNICFFAATVSLLAIARFLWSAVSQVVATSLDPRAVEAALFNVSNGIYLMVAIVAASVCRLTYLFSIEQVYAWGDLVKAAFDCYLPDLAKKMGFELADSADKRTAFWTAVSRQAIYWTQLKPEQWKVPASDARPPRPSAGRRNSGTKDCR